MIDVHGKFAVCCSIAIALGALSGVIVFLRSETAVNKNTGGRGFRDEHIDSYDDRSSTLAHHQPRAYWHCIDIIGEALGKAFWQSTPWRRSVLSHQPRAPYPRIFAKPTDGRAGGVGKPASIPVRKNTTNDEQLKLSRPQALGANMRKRLIGGEKIVSPEYWWKNEAWWQKKLQHKSDDESSDLKHACRGSTGPQGIYADSSSPQNNHSSGLLFKDDVLEAVMTECWNREDRITRIRAGTQKWFYGKRKIIEFYYDRVADESVILASRETIEYIVGRLEPLEKSRARRVKTRKKKRSIRGIFGPISDLNETQPWCLMVGGKIERRRRILEQAIKMMRSRKVQRASASVHWDPSPHGAVPVEIMGDSLNVVRMINREMRARGRWAESAVTRINGMLDESQRYGLIVPRQSGLPWCRHIYRECNKWANALAIKASRARPVLGYGPGTSQLDVPNHQERTSDLPQGFPTAVRVYFDGSLRGYYGGPSASFGWVMLASFEKYVANETLDHKHWYRVASAAAPLGSVSVMEAEMNGALEATTSLIRWVRQRRESH